MPWFASSDDKVASISIDRWIQVARDEVEDIRDWRDAIDEREDHGPEWEQLVGPLEQDTLYLGGWLAANFPHLNPNALQAVFKAIEAWYDVDRRRDHVPPQSELDSLLQDAVFQLRTADAVVLARCTETNPGCADLAVVARLDGTCSANPKYQRMLERMPPLDKKDGKWLGHVAVANAARALQLDAALPLPPGEARRAVDTLKGHRRPKQALIRYADNSAGIDKAGRHYRRESSGSQSFWYLKSAITDKPL